MGSHIFASVLGEVQVGGRISPPLRLEFINPNSLGASSTAVLHRAQRQNKPDNYQY